MDIKFILGCIKDVTREMVKGASYEIKKNLSKLATGVQVIAPILLALFCEDLMQMVVVNAVICVLVTFCKNLGHKLMGEKRTGLPVAKERYTYEEDGIVTIKKNMEEEAINYLCDVEAYLAKKGLL